MLARVLTGIEEQTYVCVCVFWGEGVTSRITAGSLIPDRHRNPDWDFSPSLPGHSHAILHGGFWLDDLEQGCQEEAGFAGWSDAEIKMDWQRGRMDGWMDGWMDGEGRGGVWWGDGAAWGQRWRTNCDMQPQLQHIDCTFLPLQLLSVKIKIKDEHSLSFTTSRCRSRHQQLITLLLYLDTNVSSA